MSNDRDRQREGWTEVFYGSQVRVETLGALLEAAGLTPEVLGTPSVHPAACQP